MSIVCPFYGVYVQTMYVGKLSSILMSKFIQKNKQGMLCLICCCHYFYCKYRTANMFKNSDFYSFDNHTCSKWSYFQFSNTQMFEFNFMVMYSQNNVQLPSLHSVSRLVYKPLFILRYKRLISCSSYRHPEETWNKSYLAWWWRKALLRMYKHFCSLPNFNIL
jgi:hypothetical protein